MSRTKLPSPRPMPAPKSRSATAPARGAKSSRSVRAAFAAPGRKRREPDGADNSSNRRADLVRVAAKLFREKGFDGTTIRDIADAVGMRSGSPFYHFANKHELLMAVMEEGLRLGLERTHDVLRDDALPPVERFRQLVRVHYGILHDTGSDFIPVMLYDWRSLPAHYRRRIIDLKDRYDTIWQQTLAALHGEGRLRADPKLARLMILGAINFSATWYRPKSAASARAGGNAAVRRVDLDELAAQTVALVLHEPRSVR